MKLLLINPNRERMPWPVVPVGLSLAATTAERAGHQVEVLDLTFSRAPQRRIVRTARRLEPEVVGLAVRNIDNCNFEHPVFYLDELRDRIMPAIRRGAPRAPVVIGGSAVNVMPKHLLRYLGADHALVGEAEATLPPFLAALAGSSARATRGLAAAATGGVAGVLSARAGGRIVGDARPARLRDLGRQPFSQAWRWVDLRPYRAHQAAYPLQAKRGCSQRCSYCVYNKIEGRAYRLRRPGAIVDEISEAFGAGVSRFELVDSTFNLPLDHALEVCEALASRGLPVRLTTMGLNPAALSLELIDAMNRAGFDSAMCTPESASDAVLRSLGKGYGRREVTEAARLLRRGGVRTFWYFLFGAPGETMRTVDETLEFCASAIPPTDLVLFSTGIRVYPDTPLERQLRTSRWLEDDDPLLLPTWYVSPDVDLQLLYDRLLRGTRAHPNWMTNAETILRPALARLMKGAFALLGWEGPFWTHLPRFFRFTERIGARGRVLEENRRRLAAIEDVVHHRGSGS